MAERDSATPVSARLDRQTGPAKCVLDLPIHAKATMQTTKATSSPEHRTSSAPAAQPAQGPLAASSSPPLPVLTSRPDLPSLFPDSVDARDAGRLEQPAQPSGTGSKAAMAATPDGKKTQGDDVNSASATHAGMKRARDGKDGPEAKPCGTEQPDQRKSSGKPLPRAALTSDHNETEIASTHATKRARKGSSSSSASKNKSSKSSKSSKSDKVPRPKPADDSASQTEAHAPRQKNLPTPTLSNQLVSTDAEPGSPTSWKHGAQSPRAGAANRASITLAPRRNSNASTMQQPSPATQTEKPPADIPVAPGTANARPLLPSDDFAFSACDSDTQGVIRVVSGSDEQGKEGQAAPIAASSQASAPTPRHGGTPSTQSVLAPDMTALMDELDAALEKPIGE